MNHIPFGKDQIFYQLQFTQRKTVAITVKPDKSVWVRAPHEIDRLTLERVLQRRALWILRQQRFFEQFHPRTPERLYIGGETHLYLGRRYRLRISPSPDPEVTFQKGYLCVSTPTPHDPTSVQAALATWYKHRAQLLFPDRLQQCHQLPAFQHLPLPPLSLRQMRTRWGSCSAAQRLTLNTELIRAPRACIDYVIIHELCHLIHPDHSARFYSFLTSVLPDWEERKMRLERLLS